MLRQHKSSIAISILVLLLSISFFTIVYGVEYEDDWWNTSWPYRQQITIYNGNASTLTDFQVKILINLTNEYASNKLNSECGNIRFTNTGGTELDYWVETCSISGENSTIWLETDSLTGSSNTNFYIYYGRSDASNNSNFSATMQKNYNSAYISGETDLVMQILMDEGSSMPKFSNVDDYQDFAVYNNDTDGSNATVHPDIVYFEDGWSGWKYWICITPYDEDLANPDSVENPSIFVCNNSCDSLEGNWSIPSGLTNPINKTPAGDHHADCDIVYNDDTDELWAYYMKWDGSVWSNLTLQNSSDGVTWSNEIFVLNQIYIQSPDYLDIDRSYSIVKNGTEWHYWANNKNASHWVYYRNSTDGKKWSNPINITFSPTPPIMPWHLDVIHVPSKNEYWMMWVPEKGDSDLYFSNSSDTNRTHWTYYSKPILIDATAGWDSQLIYRSTILYNSTNDLISLWYDGAKDAFAEHHVGFTSKTYTDLMEYLNIVELSDSSGSGINGTLNNFANTSAGAGDDGSGWRSVDGGKFDNRSDVNGSYSTYFDGSSLTFDSSDDYIEYARGAFDDMPNATVEAWVKPISLGAGGFGNIFSVGSDGSNYWQFRTHAGGKFQSHMYKGGGTRFAFTSDEDVRFNKWTHVVATLGTGGAKMYINGTEQTANSALTDAFDDLGTNLLAYSSKYVGSDSNYFNGTIDELRVYNRTLNNKEVAAHYERRKYVTPDPTVTIREEEVYTEDEAISTPSTSRGWIPELFEQEELEESQPITKGIVNETSIFERLKSSELLSKFGLDWFSLLLWLLLLLIISYIILERMKKKSK